MILRWLFSKTLREACALRNHVRRLLNAQRDLMTPAASQLVHGALLELQSAIGGRVKKKELLKQMDALEKVAGKWLRPYPHAAWRENVEVLLVALAVAMGIRTFFLQPFKIPTGSMQPTLYGVTSQDLPGDNNFKMPAGWERVKEWFAGVSYVHVVAQNDGELQ
ncbi:MAG TPA: S26 family signal peptidase, partial [Verrucomicrobiae bacterium]